MNQILVVPDISYLRAWMRDPFALRERASSRA
jgi:hypothetical protein